jgi:hypothetical protein
MTSYEKTYMKMGIEPLSKWKLFLQVFRYRFSIRGWLPKEELLKYGPESSGTHWHFMLLQSSKAGGIAAFLLNTHSTEICWKIRRDIENLIISQPDNGEQALEIAEKFVQVQLTLLLLTLLPLTQKWDRRWNGNSKMDFMHV